MIPKGGEPGEWSGAYNFGAVGGMPPGWTVRFHHGAGMWFYLPDDDADRADGVYCSPWLARRYARASVQQGEGA